LHVVSERLPDWEGGAGRQAAGRRGAVLGLRLRLILILTPIYLVSNSRLFALSRALQRANVCRPNRLCRETRSHGGHGKRSVEAATGWMVNGEW
jgi:hypothetical protein